MANGKTGGGKRSGCAANAALIAAIGMVAGRANAQISAENWGQITAPVFGTSEQGVHAGAELFAGPNKFGAYYAGVLPNGRIVKPAGISIQIGMNPLGAALTPDGKFLITSDDDERDATLNSVLDNAIAGGYGLSVLDTQTMKIVSRVSDSPVFIGLQVTGPTGGPYTVWASGGASNKILIYALDANGAVKADGAIPIAPLTAATSGRVSHYKPAANFATAGKGAANSDAPPVPSAFVRPNPKKNDAGGDAVTFPAGSALSPDGKISVRGLQRR